ncbi:MAG: hypothetical protein H7301_01300, partial [Cryobacterium sp.]|nr:hypothetical protein [Oligoflexia bacterium]
MIPTPVVQGIQSDMKMVSAESWEEMTKVLLSADASKYTGIFRIENKDLPAVQAMIKTINLEPELKSAAITLINEIFYHSVPLLKNFDQMRGNDTLKEFDDGSIPMKIIDSPFIATITMLRPRTYCYI